MLLPSPTTVCRQSTGPPGNALSQSFVFMNSPRNKLTTQLGDWLHGQHWDWYSPLQDKLITKPTPPDHASFSRTSRSTAPSFETPRSTWQTPTGYSRHQPSWSPRPSWLEKTLERTPTAASPAQTLEAHRERLPQKDQWTIDELTPPPGRPRCHVHHQRHRPLSAMDQNNFSTSSFAVESTDQSLQVQGVNRHLDHRETNRPAGGSWASRILSSHHLWTP
jgi:hypothetical protein